MVANKFRYPIIMPFIVLSELDEVRARHWSWRTLVRFRRTDFLGDPLTPLEESVRQVVDEQLGRRPSGPIVLLAQWRMWGFHFNPLSVYYCYRDDGVTLDAVVLEVRSTPWLERHVYVLDGASSRHRFAKEMHVSPFLGMDHEYVCSFSAPSGALRLHLGNRRGEERIFDATLALRRHDLTAAMMARVALLHGAENLLVTVRIYAQALRLLIKRAPYFAHPRSTASGERPVRTRA